MKKARLPIALLLVLIILADLWVALRLNPARVPYKQPSQTTIIAAEALAFSQVSLAAAWLALGGGTPGALWRLAAAWPVLVFWCRLLRSSAMPGDWQLLAAAWAITLLAQATAMATPLMVARYSGFVLADVESGDTRARRLQFSLGGLMLWTGGMAVFLALFSYAVSYDFLRFILHWLPPARLLELLALGIGHAAVGLSCLWAVLGKGRRAVRLLVFCLVVGSGSVIGVIAVYCSLPAGRAPDFAAVGRFALLPLLDASLLIGYLWLVRCSGFRLLR